MASNLRFGITSDLSGLSQGIIVNSIAKNNTTESAQARDHLGNIMDIAAFSDDKNVTIDGLYVGEGLQPGTMISVNNQNYMVVSTGREESNTAFQTASINARLFPGEGPGPGPGPGPIEPNPSLCFKGVDDEGSYIQLNQYGSPSAVQLAYRKNNGSWTTYNVGDVIILNRNDVVFLSGANDHFSKDSSNFYYFTIDGDVETSGNIMSLMNFSDSCTYSCFNRLFSNCDALLTAPQLPATTLAMDCYEDMFYHCSSLSTAPDLSATTLVRNCYEFMFNGCSSLTAVPDLPATDLKTQCYWGMFANCSSLITPPSLPATTLAIECYKEMFANCSSLTSAPNLSVTILANGCYQEMFSGCVSLSAAPALPATTLTDYCYSHMFAGCSNLLTAPALPATTLKLQCYQGMFFGCKKLSSAPSILPATILKPQCYQSMFSSCSSLIKAPKLPATTLADSCYYGMFRDCKSLTAAPSLPATTLVEDCYNQMFDGCNKLSSIEVSFTDWTQATNATSMWVMFIDSIGTFTKPFALSEEYGNSRIPTNWQVVNDPTTIPLTFKAVNSSGAVALNKMGSPNPITLSYRKNNGSWTTYNIGDSIILDQNDKVYISGANGSFSKSLVYNNYYHFSMTGTIEAAGNIQSLMNFSSGVTSCCFVRLFENCTSLISAPQLLATTLNEQCYTAMFIGCTNLSTAPDLPAMDLSTACYMQMFAGCTSLTASPHLFNNQWPSLCFANMFNGCTSLRKIYCNIISWQFLTNQTTDWVKDVPNDGTYYGSMHLVPVQSQYYGVDKIPPYWTVVGIYP